MNVLTPIKNMFFAGSFFGAILHFIHVLHSPVNTISVKYINLLWRTGVLFYLNLRIWLILYVLRCEFSVPVLYVCLRQHKVNRNTRTSIRNIKHICRHGTPSLTTCWVRKYRLCRCTIPCRCLNISNYLSNYIVPKD